MVNFDQTQRDQFSGAILGLAIGDALGLPTEFRRRYQILEAFGSQGVTDFEDLHDSRWSIPPIIIGPEHPKGTYTDDTQMAIAVAQGLLEAGDEDIDTLMSTIGKQFVAWSHSPENNRAPGETCMVGCSNLEKGIPWYQAGVPRSKGCGSAMRVAPIGLFYCHNYDKLLEVARASSLLTHGHDASIEGAAAAALLVALALAQHAPEEMYQILLEKCGPHSTDFKTCLEKLPDFVSKDPEIALSAGGLGEGWVAEEAVVSALYCIWRYPDSYEKAVLTAINTDGDSDSIGCITGSISGAWLGLTAIPDTWRTQVENSAYLHTLADQLWTLHTQYRNASLLDF